MTNIKFVYNAVHYSNVICHNLLDTKLNCMPSTFSEYYQYHSYKYQLSDRGLEHLLGKVTMIISEFFLGSPTAMNVVPLCSIRDHIVICNTINNKDTCKLINLLCTDTIVFY